MGYPEGVTKTEKREFEEGKIWKRGEILAGSFEGGEEGKREFARGGEMIRSELIEPESGAGRQLEREIRRLVSACCFRLGLRESEFQER